MRKSYLMKSMALVAIAAAAASCNHDAWNERPDTTKQQTQEYANNFRSIVLGGQNMDPRQTWNTAVKTQVTTTISKTGTLKIYTVNPIGATAAPIYTATVTEGEAKTFAVARPQGATTLYAAIIDNDGYFIENMAFDASQAQSELKFFQSSANAPQQAPRRAIQPSFQFPSDADASKFLADVPAGVEKLVSGIGKTNHYLDPTYEGNVNIWGIGSAENGWVAEGGILYVKGNCDFSNRSFYFAGNSELFLLEGATLTLSANDAGNLQTNTKIYMAANSKIVTSGELKLNNGLHIYNHGTIEANKLSTNSNSVLYNVGTVTIATKISVENTLSVIVNDGTITAADLQTAGSGKFMNNKDVTISGNTVVNSNDNTWVNNGQYHTGYFYYHAASDEVINNCRLTVDEDFNINLGDNPGNGNFKMDAGSGVVTKNFNGGGNFTNATQNWVSYNGGPFYIYMGANSVFEVTETATMNATKANYGIYGPETGDYAVFHAKNIVAGKAEQGYEVTYGGNLFVASDTHFANGFSGQYPYIDIKDGAKVAKFGNTADVSINATACNPGYNGGKADPDPKQYIYFAFEDLGTSDDFDFNDVVVRVSYPDENNISTVELCAIGGTLECTVFNGTAQIGQEVHSYGAFGANTSNWVRMPLAQLGTVNVPEGTTVAQLNINIQVKQSDGRIVTVTGPEQGEIPFRVCVTGDEQGRWYWAKERVNISSAYPKFGAWGANIESCPEWYKEPVAASVMQWQDAE